MVEDSRVSMRAVSNLISLQPGVKIVGMALDGEDGLQLARTLQPDIVFADLEMPGRSGLEVVEVLRREIPNMKLVVISVHEGDVWRNLALSHGANAFVSKSELAEKLPGLFWEFFETARPRATGCPPTVVETPPLNSKLNGSASAESKN